MKSPRIAVRSVTVALLWCGVLLYVICSAGRSRRHRRALTVGRIEVEVADSSARGHLLTGETVRRWIASSGVKTVGAPAGEVDLRALEGAIAANGFVSRVRAGIDYGGVLRVEVSQRTPAVRLRMDGYDAYATDEGYVFAAPPRSAVYVPVVTGGYRPPFPASYAGDVRAYTEARIAESEARIAEIEREKYPLYKQERENDEALRELRRHRVKRGLLEKRENYARRVEEWRAERERLRRIYRYRERRIQTLIDRISKRQEAERLKQKKLGKSCEDFLKLVNFVEIIQSDDFWRSQIVQIVAHSASDGSPDLELIPRAGGHTVLFGGTDDATEKLDKLMVFYRKGLQNIGWERYGAINVKYKEQVVCTK